MITKVKISGYRKYKGIEFTPKKKFNLIAGANESGKSTLMEAIALGLTGKINGRPAIEELNPFSFNSETVNEFVRSVQSGGQYSWPEICIEIFFQNEDRLQQLCGAVNSDVPTNACPGITFRVIPDPEYAQEREAWIQTPKALIPIEYYKIDWRSFADHVLTARPKDLVTAVIDSRTVRSSTGVDYHMRSILNDGLHTSERTAISVAYREVKDSMSSRALASVNSRLSTFHTSIHNQPISLAMDQSSRTSWEGAIIPHVNDVPFSMSGQGQQAAIKISLAMNRYSQSASIVIIEEPENHLTHTSLNTLLSRIEKLAGENQQLFIATHSSFVINRLGLDGLNLLGPKGPRRLSDLSPGTIGYFQKLPGYDTLRIVLAEKIVFVEGPSDEIIFERIFKDRFSKRPIECGIDVLSLRGLSFGRCFELCSALDKKAVAIRDNDGKDPSEISSRIAEWLVVGKRQIFISKPENGPTLEPQLISSNGEEKLRRILGITESADLS